MQMKNAFVKTQHKK